MRLSYHVQANSATSPKPRLIVVTGRPGAGKSTLAHPLARALGLPALCRDEFKQGLGITRVEPVLDEASARHANAAFFDAIRLLVGRGISHVAEAAFGDRVWRPELEPIVAAADVRIVLCHVDADLAQARHMARAEADPGRARFHDVGLLPEAYAPPCLDVPTLGVDTTDGYRPDFDAIVAFAGGL